MNVRQLIKKLEKLDPEMEVVVFNDIGKGVRDRFNVSTPHYVTQEDTVHSLAGEPIALEKLLLSENYPHRYLSKKCVLINP